MNFESYLAYFDEILNSKQPAEPYDNPDYLNYTQLNYTRMNRWLKHGKINAELKNVIQNIKQPQTWIIITEPWCGDAAQIVPFFEMVAQLNPKIKTEYELRDSEPHRINDYLTNGKSKSIPILVVKDENGTDIFSWGPRPKKAQELHYHLKDKEADFEEMKVTMQKWYNKDKGEMLQNELTCLIQKQQI